MNPSTTSPAFDRTAQLWQQFVEQCRQGETRDFDSQWRRFQALAAQRPAALGPLPAWLPGERELTDSNLAVFMRERGLASYAALHRWSTRQRADFWQHVITRLSIVFSKAPETILAEMTDARNPDWLPGAVMNIADNCFRSEAQRPAIISGSETTRELRTHTYRELLQLANRIANSLRQHGFEKEEAIALYMPMTVECVAAYLAIVNLGGRVVSIADSFSAPELQKRLQIAGATALITVHHYERGGKRIELYSKVLAAAAPRAIVVPPADDSARMALRHGDISWSDFLSADDEFESVPCKADEVSNLLFSSGTTATPKAIPWTHLTPLKCAMDGHFHQDIHPGEVVAWPTNIGWMMGPWLIYATFINRGTMALFEGSPLSREFIAFVRDAKVSILGVIPSLVRSWRSSEAIQWDEWQEVRLFSSTGEPSNREDYLWLMSRTGYRAPVIEYLGGTEIGGGHLTSSVLQPCAPATFTTPALGIDFVVLDEKNQPAAEHGAGELFLIPPAIGLSQTLLNKDHDEVYYAGCPPGPNGEILRRHGDQIQRLPGGCFKAAGRADDAMNLGGIKVSALELEQVIDDHEAVYESAAVAVQPEGEGQERLVIFAVLKNAVGRDDLQRQLGKLIAKRLNPLFRIHQLVIVDKLPRTASNKLMRRELRASFQQSDR